MVSLRVNLISVVSALIMVSGIKSLPMAEESINTNEPYKTLEIKSKISHKQTFIFFHGLEGSSKIWDQFKAQFSDALPNTKFLIPDAPKSQLGAADNRVAPSWYNIQSYTGLQKEDVAGIQEAISNVHKMIQSEIDSGIPANKIIIGGFSQGAALSLASGIRFKEQLGGIVALSGYLPLMSQTPETNNNSPIFWATGEHEQPGLSILGKLGQETLKKTGHEFDLHTYPGLGHDLNAREMQDVIEFAKKNLGQESPKKTGDNSKQHTTPKSGDKSEQHTYPKSGDKSEQQTYPKSGDKSEQQTYPKSGDKSEQQTYPESGNDLNKPEMEKVIEYAKQNLDEETLKKVAQNFEQQTKPELGQDLNTPEMQKVIEFAKNNLGHAK